MYNTTELEKIIADYYPEFTGIHPACSLIPMILEDDYATLCKDIADNGLLNKLSRTSDGLLLDGRARLMACFDTNSEIRVVTVESSDYWMWSISTNVCRSHLSPIQRTFLAIDYQKHLENTAKEIQL
jgi:hypothetical protein